MRPTEWQKSQIAARAFDRCEYCQAFSKYAPYPFSVEHIIPQSRGGRTELNNLAFSCQGCNNHKYTKVLAKDDITGRETPLFHPRNHFWLDHFAWAEDGKMIIGLIHTGRATIIALNLNRENLVNYRSMAINFNIHPPDKYALN